MSGFQRLDDVTVTDRTDDHYGKTGCIGAIDDDFVPGRPYLVNFGSTSGWYGDDQIVAVFNLEPVRQGLEVVGLHLDGLVGHDNPDPGAVVHTLDMLRVVVKNLVGEVEKLAKAGERR